MNIFLTGGSRGIGKEIKKIFEDNNHIVICPTRDELPLNDFENVKKFLNNFDEKIDILINNAGVNDPCLLKDLTVEKFHELFDINFTSHLMITKHFLNQFMSTGYGRIINIGSVRTQIIKTGRFSYSLSKSSFETLSKYIALEHSKNNILSNTISPGYVNSDMLYKFNDENTINNMLKDIPINKFCEPIEIAKLCYFLTVENNYITGQNIFIDGGLSAI